MVFYRAILEAHLSRCLASTIARSTLNQFLMDKRISRFPFTEWRSIPYTNAVIAILGV
jgi:hypothetical protein